MSYATGHVKRNPDSGEIAFRTSFSEDMPSFENLAWIICTTTWGARNAKTAEVDAWDDLYIPQEGS